MSFSLAALNLFVGRGREERQQKNNNKGWTFIGIEIAHQNQCQFVFCAHWGCVIARKITTEDNKIQSVFFDFIEWFSVASDGKIKCKKESHRMDCITQHMSNTLRSAKREFECIAFLFLFSSLQKKKKQVSSITTQRCIREQQCAFK